MSAEPGRDAAVRTRLATRDDLPAVVELMALGLGEGRAPRTLEFFEWKHLRNPFGTSPVLLAEGPSGIVGIRAFMRWRFASGGRTVDAVRAVDTVTHPDFRGMGIFRRLTLELVDRLSDEGVPFVFNTPNESSRPGYLKMGWRDVTRLDLWARPIIPFGVTPHAADPVSRLCDRAELGDLLEQANAGGGDALRTAQSVDYVRWRYAAPPGFDYRARATDGALDAAIVYLVRRRRGLRELTILELWSRPTAVGIRRGRRLLRDLLKASGATYAVAASPSRSASAVLALSGFVPLPRAGPRLTARTLSSLADPDPFDRSHWRYSLGDMELF